MKYPILDSPVRQAGGFRGSSRKKVVEGKKADEDFPAMHTPGKDLHVGKVTRAFPNSIFLATVSS